MKRLKKTPYYFYKYLAKQTDMSKPHITLFAIVMMINFPLFGVLWKFETFQFNEEFYLRMMATVLCGFLASHSLWIPAFKKCKCSP